MFNFLDPYIQIIKLIISIVIILIITSDIMYINHLRNEVSAYKSAGQIQVIQSKEKDKSNESNATESVSNLKISDANIDSYYKSNPVSVLNTCPSSMPKTISDKTGIDETSKSDISTTQQDSTNYISGYNPEVVELMAVQLDTLMKNLIEDGVQIDGD